MSETTSIERLLCSTQRGGTRRKAARAARTRARGRANLSPAVAALSAVTLVLGQGVLKHTLLLGAARSVRHGGDCCVSTQRGLTSRAGPYAGSGAVTVVHSRRRMRMPRIPTLATTGGRALNLLFNIPESPIESRYIPPARANPRPASRRPPPRVLGSPPRCSILRYLYRPRSGVTQGAGAHRPDVRGQRGRPQGMALIR